MSWRDKPSGKTIKASSGQIGMLRAIAFRKGIKGVSPFLEWLEFDSCLDIKLTFLDELDAGLVGMVKQKLEKLPDSE